MDSFSQHTVISCQDLSIGYKNKKKVAVIASAVGFSITQGTLVALVGSNGIGKSTLLKSLTAMLPPLSGSLQIDAKEITAYSALELSSKLSVVLTEAPASKNLTVLELVSLGRQPHTNWMGKLTKNDKDIIQQALEDTDLVSLKNKNCFMIQKILRNLIKILEQQVEWVLVIRWIVFLTGLLNIM